MVDSRSRDAFFIYSDDCFRNFDGNGCDSNGCGANRHRKILFSEATFALHHSFARDYVFCFDFG